MNWISNYQELRKLIYGDITCIPQGLWVVTRIFRLNQLSPYWREDLNEAIGGPKYMYDDFLVRSICKPGTVMTKADNVRSGQQPLDSLLIEEQNIMSFAFVYDENLPNMLKGGDLIYMIDKHGSINKPDPPFIITDRFKIKNIVKDYGDYGNIEAIYATAARIHGES